MHTCVHGRQMFLGSLSSSDGAPATSWARESARRRAKYDELLQRMMSTPAEKSADTETVKPQVIDPLSNAADVRCFHLLTSFVLSILVIFASPRIKRTHTMSVLWYL
jgi:hypothetical protein